MKKVVVFVTLKFVPSVERLNWNKASLTDGCIFINLNIYSLYVLSIPLVKSIVELLLAVCVDIKFNPPPANPLGFAVIADKELLFAKLRAIV